jgi:hypothetical protein
MPRDKTSRDITSCDPNVLSHYFIGKNIPGKASQETNILEGKTSKNKTSQTKLHEGKMS